MTEITSNYIKRSFKFNIKNGFKDLGNSLNNWRIFSTMGINDIRTRYIRSRLGQLWLTLSLAINIATLGIIFSYLFHTPVKTFLPYVAIGIIFWTFINASITEGGTILITNSFYLQELNIGKSSYIFSLFIKNIIILGHNLIILIPLYFFSNFFISGSIILSSFIGLLLTLLFLFPLALSISIISLRYRDFPNIINSLMQIMFYLTPVMWKIELITPDIQKLIEINPFCIFLTLCRNPFINDALLPQQYYIGAVFYIIASWLVGFLFFCKYRQKITYWL